MARSTVNIDGYEDRFRKLLPRSQDTTLLVLKGHLLMEELVNELVTGLLPNPAVFSPTQIRLHDRICLAQALLPNGEAPLPLEAALTLNTLRNRLAHHLEHPQVDQLIAEFLRAFEDPEALDEFGTERTATRLRRCIAFLCGMLAGMVAGIRAVKDRKARA
ncbi:hypothetical protein GBZ48_10525 [Azospirillum melinis]|uniref:DUF4145 domain-containing protein n=1 Tax=Azospirillum melinis TaxID=328839 RepID=A0ABX2KAK1_9PROT|nr:hypothetical protein [Azospirillum melinis]MBP2304762.1 hypothetical protein [Azospirillum melinis]NUA99727.1 hypothetical protein [Azospirillum melinis]